MYIGIDVDDNIPDTSDNENLNGSSLLFLHYTVHLYR